MMENNDEQLVYSFLEANRQEIPDNGFSHEVYEKLPSAAWRKNRVWRLFCIAIGLIFVYFANLVDLIPVLINRFSTNFVQYIHGIELPHLTPVILVGVCITLSLLLINTLQDIRTYEMKMGDV